MPHKIGFRCRTVVPGWPLSRRLAPIADSRSMVGQPCYWHKMIERSPMLHNYMWQSADIREPSQTDTNGARAHLAALRVMACREALTGFLTLSSFSGVASKADVSTASRTTSSRAFCNGGCSCLRHSCVICGDAKGNSCLHLSCPMPGARHGI